MTVSVVLGGFSDVRIKPHSGSVSAFARTQGGDNFILEAGRDEIRNYVRDGNDLIVEFVDGQRLTIKNFFAQNVDYHNLVLESGAVRQLVDFSHALDDQERDAGDGVDDEALSYRPVYAEKQGEGGLREPSAKDPNIDYDTIVSSTDSGSNGGGVAKFFSGKSVFSALGGLGAAGALAGYAYDRGDDDEGDDFFNPLDGMEIPDPLIPPPPPPSDDELESSGSDGVLESSGADLRFFSTGAHFIETRIIDPNQNLPFPTFSMPVLIGPSSGQVALPFLAVEDHRSNPYLGIYARISDELAEGEKVQLRVGNGQWYDAEKDVIGSWRFSKPQAEMLKAENNAYLIESRVVGQDDRFLRSGGSLILESLYNNATREMKKNFPVIANIDLPGQDQPFPDPFYLVSDADMLSIGGKVIGKFGQGHKVQIRIDGGGWYDVTISKQGTDHIIWQYDDLPTYASSAGNDRIVLENNVRDTLVYHLLDGKDATGGNGSDIIHNFTIGKWGEADVDRIDISSLLVDYDGAPSHYLWSEQEGGNTMLYLYRDGSTEGTVDTSLLFTLMGVQTSLEKLYENGQLILA